MTTATKKERKPMGQEKAIALQLQLRVFEETHTRNISEFWYVQELTGYSENNCMMIIMQCYERRIHPLDLRAIKGYETWKHEGQMVQTGEKGFKIFSPVIKKDTITCEEKLVNSFAQSVFHFAQTKACDVGSHDVLEAKQQTAQAKYDRIRAQILQDAPPFTEEGYRQWQEAKASQKVSLKNGEKQARQVLNIALDAVLTYPLLQKAFHKAAMCYHPDISGSNEDAMKKVNAAHDALEHMYSW